MYIYISDEGKEWMTYHGFEYIQEDEQGFYFDWNDDFDSWLNSIGGKFDEATGGIYPVNANASWDGMIVQAEY